MFTILIWKKSVFFLFSLCICLVSTSLVPKTSQIDLIIQGLEEQEWLSDETKCLQDTLLILSNVKNHTLWASWIWNSNQFLVGTFHGSRYSLGNYDQCLKGPSKDSNQVMRTQYCTANVKLTADKGKKTNEEANVYENAEDFLSFKNKNGRVLNLITWGTCLPATCKPESISKILMAIYLINPITSVEPNITVDDCQTSGEKTVYSQAFYVFISITVILIVTALLLTLYVEYIDKEINSTIKKIAHSFSLLRNWSSFTRISRNDEIPVLHFAKAVHVVTCTCAHSYMFTLTAGVSNGVDVDYLLSVKSNMFMNLIHHIDLAFVEIFFVMSGLLVVKGLMEKKTNPIIVLIKRYIRLIGSFAFTVFYCIAVSKYTGDGPLWNKLIGREQKVCEENWIWSLLLLNNYVNSDGICRVVSWYLPCDYHLAVMGTVLFLIWQWNRQAGKMTTIAAAILAVLLPGVVTYWRRLPGIMAYDIEEIIDWRKNQVYLHINLPSHHRIGTYLLGMALGYIFATYKPAKYRGVISKKWCIIGYTVSGIIGFYVWSSAGFWCLDEYNVWNSTVYAALNKNIWALSTCVCIAISEYGDLSELRTILAWPVFVITSRVSYGVYIVHSLIIERNSFSLRNPVYHDLITAITNGFGVFVLSGGFAILLLLFVEMPLSNLTNLILDPKKQNMVNGDQRKNNTNHIAEMKNGKCL